MNDYIHDIEEYHSGYSQSENGFDDPSYDDIDYEYTAKQSGYQTMPVFMPERYMKLLLPYMEDSL